MVIIKALPQRNFDKEYLHGAINIDHKEIKSKASNVVSNKNTFIVVYCLNTGCNNSKIASDSRMLGGSKTVLRLGFR